MDDTGPPLLESVEGTLFTGTCDRKVRLSLLDMVLCADFTAFTAARCRRMVGSLNDTGYTAVQGINDTGYFL